MLPEETSFIQAQETKGPYVANGSCVMLVTSPYVATQKIVNPAMSHSVCKWRYSDQNLKYKRIPTPSQLITNLVYKLKPHQTWNQYLTARLNTCADVNIMPASVYKLMFNDTKLKKLAPSTLEIDTHTTDKVKIAGSCLFCLVHSDTKKLQEVTFYVAQNDGSVLLSCTTTLVLGLM